jgi:hypothetical protein
MDIEDYWQVALYIQLPMSTSYYYVYIVFMEKQISQTIH